MCTTLLEYLVKDQPKIKVGARKPKSKVHEDGKNVVTTLLTEEKDMQVWAAQIEADLFAESLSDLSEGYALEEPSERYAIKVIARNMPRISEQEPTVAFEIEDANKLERAAASFEMEAAVAFVIMDDYEGERKVRVFFATLANLHALANDAHASFIDYDGKTGNFSLRIRQDDNKNYIDEHFRGENVDKWDGMIDYTELPESYIDYAKWQIPF